MRPSRVTQTGVGNSVPIPLDTYGRAQSLLQAVVTGTVTYTLQETADNVFDLSITPTWFDIPDPNVQLATTSQQSAVNQPPAAVRVSVSAGTGSVLLTVLSSATN